MTDYHIVKFPRTRIATFDIGSISKTKHNISALIEVDVTDARRKIKEMRQERGKLSFTAYLIKSIADTMKKHSTVGGYLKGKRKLLVFEHVSISIVVEKYIEGRRVPIPMIIEKAEEKSAFEISAEIESAKNKLMTSHDIVLHKKSERMEGLYYSLPGLLRRMVWKFLLNNPKLAYKSMGNAILTSVGMMGKINGWFLPTTIHPVSFGISSITLKPRIIKNKILPRDILNMTIVMDHNVIDGADMARFVVELVKTIENG
ncbi:MAG: 2-oxo acid dehydrogenase subunit E2 [Candidatus Marinimicrobia bacterium]|nr:2-oxo acid dehydrogenase subunit E2 [Candidatus Neomarinimicrobiota bacterium]